MEQRDASSHIIAHQWQDGSGSVLAIAGVMRIVRLLRLARPDVLVVHRQVAGLHISRLLRGFLVCQELRLLVTGTGLLFNVAEFYEGNSRQRLST